jgi:hypothetical protein
LTEWKAHSDRSDEDYGQDLDPSISGSERRELLKLAQRLTEQRPVPRPGLRSMIRSRMLGAGTRPISRSRVGGVILGYAASGALLLMIAAAGLVGLGPFAA